jgi:hypothetical protein
MADLLNRLPAIAASGVCSQDEAIEMARLLLSARTRRTDPDTSRQAAASVTAMTARRRAVLDLLRRVGPSTDVQLTYHYGQSVQDEDLKQTPQSVRSRRSELVRMGYVVEHGTTQIGGRTHTVWAVR